MKNFFTKLILPALLVFVFTKTQAQDLPYLFLVETDTYVELTGATEVTSVGDFWDDPFFKIPIGFNFTFFEYATDTLHSSELLGGAFTLVDISTYPEPFPILFAYYSDIADRENGNPALQSSISYKTEGPAGDQILKVEWKEVGFYNEVFNGSAENWVSFQMWLYEKTGDIEIRFGPSNIVNSAILHDDPGGPTVAMVDKFDIANYSIDNFWYLTGAPENPDVMVTDFYGLYSFTGMSGEPVNGQMYRFINPDTKTQNIDRNFSVKIYPTQVINELFVEVDQAVLESETTLRISNQLGQIVFEKAITSTKENFDVSTLASGNYFATIENEDGRATKKFLK